MKIKLSFVTNSSSTAYMITNLSNEKKSLVDFVLENIELVDQFNQEYREDYTRLQVLESAANENFEFNPGEQKQCVFGDEDGTIIGRVYDYILRDGGISKNFEWRYYESLR
jgi:hypothetical protein